MLVLVVIIVVVVVMMVMLVLVFIVIVVVAAMMVMLVLVFIVIVIVVVMVVVMLVLIVLVGSFLVCLSGKLAELGDEVAASVQHLEDLISGDKIPVRGDYARRGVLRPYEGDGRGKLILVHALGAAQNYRAGVADLIVIKLAEVFHIHTDLLRVRDGYKGAKLDRELARNALNGAGDVGELADSARLDEDELGLVFLDNVPEGGAEIADEAAADAAVVQLVYSNAALLKKAAVDADLAEFVFDEDDALALEALFYELFNKSGLSGA